MTKKSPAKQSEAPAVVEWEMPDAAFGVAYSDDGRHIVTASWSHVMVWDAAKRVLVRHIQLENRCVCWKAVASHGIVAAGFGDVSMRLFDLASGKELRRLEGLEGIVASLAFSKDGTKLFTGNCGDKTVRLWNVSTGKLLASGKTKKSATWFVAMSPDATTAVSACADKLVHVWDLKKGCTEARALAGHTSKINACELFGDGKRVVTGSSDKTARIWDLAKGKQLAVLAPHKKAVSAVAVSPDGKTVASGSLDGAIVLWDSANGTERTRFVTAAGLAGIAFSPDGKQFVSGGGDKKLRLWTI